MILEHLHGEGEKDALLLVVEGWRPALGNRLQRLGPNAGLDCRLGVGIPRVLCIEKRAAIKRLSSRYFGAIALSQRR
jgi:hypothetical protein